MTDQFPQTTAENLLSHYFRTVWEKAGLDWTDDNSSEVETIVESILQAAKQAVFDELGAELQKIIRERK